MDAMDCTRLTSSSASRSVNFNGASSIFSFLLSVDGSLGTVKSSTALSSVPGTTGRAWDGVSSVVEDSSSFTFEIRATEAQVGLG